MVLGLHGKSNRWFNEIYNPRAIGRDALCEDMQALQKCTDVYLTSKRVDLQDTNAVAQALARLEPRMSSTLGHERVQTSYKLARAHRLPLATLRGWLNTAWVEFSDCPLQWTWSPKRALICGLHQSRPGLLDAMEQEAVRLLDLYNSSYGAAGEAIPEVLAFLKRYKDSSHPCRTVVEANCTAALQRIKWHISRESRLKAASHCKLLQEAATVMDLASWNCAELLAWRPNTARIEAWERLQIGPKESPIVRLASRFAALEGPDAPRRVTSGGITTVLHDPAAANGWESQTNPERIGADAALRLVERAAAELQQGMPDLAELLTVLNLTEEAALVLESAPITSTRAAILRALLVEPAPTLDDQLSLWGRFAEASPPLDTAAWQALGSWLAAPLGRLQLAMWNDLPNRHADVWVLAAAKMQALRDAGAARSANRHWAALAAWQPDIDCVKRIRATMEAEPPGARHVKRALAALLRGQGPAWFTRDLNPAELAEHMQTAGRYMDVDSPRLATVASQLEPFFREFHDHPLRRDLRVWLFEAFLQERAAFVTTSNDPIWDAHVLLTLHTDLAPLPHQLQQVRGAHDGDLFNVFTQFIPAPRGFPQQLSSLPTHMGRAMWLPHMADHGIKAGTALASLEMQLRTPAVNPIVAKWDMHESETALAEALADVSLNKEVSVFAQVAYLWAYGMNHDAAVLQSHPFLAFVGPQGVRQGSLESEHDAYERALSLWTGVGPMPIYMDRCLAHRWRGNVDGFRDFWATLQRPAEHSEPHWQGCLEVVVRGVAPPTPSRANPPFTCSICLEPQEAGARALIQSCSCTSPICMPCARQAVDACESATHRGHCPTGCGAPLLRRDLEQLGFAPDDVQRHLRTILARELQHSPLWTWCKTPDCLGGGHCADSSDSFTCALCGVHNSMAHRPEGFDKSLISSLLTSLGATDSTLGNGLTRECYQCGAATEKTGACAHMTCSSCSGEWHFVSGQYHGHNYAIQDPNGTELLGASGQFDELGAAAQNYRPLRDGPLGRLGFYEDVPRGILNEERRMLLNHRRDLWLRSLQNLPERFTQEEMKRAQPSRETAAA